MSEIQKKEIAPVPSGKAMAISPEKVNLVEVGEDAEGQRIDNFLIRAVKGIPKSHVYRVLRKGEGAQLLLAAAARARGRALPLFGGLPRSRGRRLKLS